jgi:histidinol dehydrogenase
MTIYTNPSKETWPALTQRPQLELEYLESTVKNILTRVKNSDDAAVRELTLKLDKVDVTELRVSVQEMENAKKELSASLKEAIVQAQQNIEAFHTNQLQTTDAVETMPGVVCWRKNVAIEKVGIYIPGGTAPLFSTVLMLGTPAKLAGCNEVVLCSPPDSEGHLHPAILFAASVVGITKVFKVGGAQAIAAMAYGTKSIPKVSKIFGPGNQYVTMAKQLVNKDGIAIDMPAGPSEVLVLADASADASFIAADLLSQAEHGADSQVVLVVLDEAIVNMVQQEIQVQLQTLPRKEVAEQALKNSRVIFYNDLQTAIQFVNEYAPEHLIINTKNDDAIADAIRNAGSIFLGNYSPEAAGDYASGTNHTLPTNGFAKAYSGVSVESFTKKITYQRLSKEGLQRLGPIVETMAEAEQLTAHKRAISIRLAKL